jgi:hypothetical protein
MTRSRIVPAIVFGIIALCLPVHGVHAAGGPPGGDVRALAIDPVTPATIYAGMWGGGVFKSTNGGTSWTSASSGFSSEPIVNTLAIDPRDRR